MINMLNKERETIHNDTIESRQTSFPDREKYDPTISMHRKFDLHW